MNAHKIVINAVPETEAELRIIAGDSGCSLADVASQIVACYINERLLTRAKMRGEVADMLQHPKIYISGPITNDPDYKAKFKTAQNLLEAEGYEVKNPAELIVPTPDKEWSDYMALAIAYMLPCEQVYMLKGWEDSTGATLELKLAVVLGKKIIYQGE